MTLIDGQMMTLVHKRCHTRCKVRALDEGHGAVSCAAGQAKCEQHYERWLEHANGQIYGPTSLQRRAIAIRRCNAAAVFRAMTNQGRQPAVRRSRSTGIVQ